MAAETTAVFIEKSTRTRRLVSASTIRDKRLDGGTTTIRSDDVSHTSGNVSKVSAFEGYFLESTFSPKSNRSIL